ncbi:MAG: hypothetical protein K0S76_356 [Herbinix sp.]|jgi:hypothetical protein|nr:hypothetical protein [Herbinix sp.]
MSKSKKIFIGVFGFLLGMVVGFLISPIKKGIEIGNNCGNSPNYYGREGVCETI